ncbi:translation initiation factor IF-6 [Methanohalophilus profundi]|uniref:translation initiation factor IF-6 n=1 Tax=Methanohalophilus profundi TaxID=2138083 RepID=UPI00101CFDEC|nr:translation initiation factor IF-6 [Methanohalophilus profundi]
MIRTLNIYENPVIGVFATCTEDFALVPPGTNDKTSGMLEEILDVEVVSTLVNGSVVVGSLSKGNSSGFLVPRGSSPLPKKIDLPVAEVPDNLSAIGNIVLANDSAALVHPDISDKAIEIIGKTLSVDVRRGTIAGIKTVGMAGVVTNHGLLAHPMIKQEEVSILEDLFGLNVEIGTVNYGSQVVGSGVLANSSGYVAGSETTGHELGRIEDALMFD